MHTLGKHRTQMHPHQHTTSYLFLYGLDNCMVNPLSDFLPIHYIHSHIVSQLPWIQCKTTFFLKLSFPHERQMNLAEDYSISTLNHSADL